MSISIPFLTKLTRWLAYAFSLSLSLDLSHTFSSHTYLGGISYTSTWLCLMQRTLRLYAKRWYQCRRIHRKRLGRLLIRWRRRLLILNSCYGIVSVNLKKKKEYSISNRRDAWSEYITCYLVGSMTSARHPK